MDFLPIKRAILSVTDKSGLAEFADFLAKGGVELVSTGGTYKALTQAGLAVTQVSAVTGFPEILGGRVKTLNPLIHGGILADKDDPSHLATLREHKITPVDLVCVNLYNFADAAAKNPDLKALVEEIDIGGPCMIRAAAKNFHSVLVVPNINLYTEVQAALAANNMRAPLPLRLKCSQAAFALTASYDAMIAKHLEKQP